MFDIAIIGAGINGCALAYFLTQAGKRVIVFDGGGIASGGSGAAGAFISPKIAKGGDLKAISDEAFSFSLDFYNQHFPQHITNAPLLHLSKHLDENEKVRHFKAHTSLHVSDPSEEQLERLDVTCKDFEGLYLEQSAVVDAKAMCEALIGDTTFINTNVTSLTCKEDYYDVLSYQARQVIFATGAYKKVLDLPYIAHRGVWGHRIDIATSTQIPFNIHQYVSISASHEGKAAIGATHNVHYHPQKNTQPYDIQAGREELLTKATMTIALEDVTVLRDYTGLRSGSNDYLPLIGPLVDAKTTLAKLPNLMQGSSYQRGEFVYYPNAYMINGTGGYGFVLAPYLARALSRYICDNIELDTRLNPTRFFERWVKKSLS